MDNRGYKHGLTTHPCYRRWTSMKNRCYNVNSDDYINYGARGITVCDEWVNDIVAFCKWCDDNGYKDGLHIDRIDNNKSYSPDNCHFITQKENNAIGKRRVRKDCKTGEQGITINKHGSYVVHLSVCGKQLYLGSYKSLEEAKEVRSKNVNKFKEEVLSWN